MEWAQRAQNVSFYFVFTSDCRYQNVNNIPCHNTSQFGYGYLLRVKLWTLAFSARYWCTAGCGTSLGRFISSVFNLKRPKLFWKYIKVEKRLLMTSSLVTNNEGRRRKRLLFIRTNYYSTFMYLPRYYLWDFQVN